MVCMHGCGEAFIGAGVVEIAHACALMSSRRRACLGRVVGRVVARRHGVGNGVGSWRHGI